MEKNPLGVRKGIWTPEEDILLKKCVENYGEGKWHLVPLRAGLNRCRKSCRLRWLNYLKPNIKRGQFTKDEVDLIIRLHKLLGNRWSLIAGRLPGRTANDVKNFWNTHIEKKSFAGEVNSGRVNAQKPITLRPQPRTFDIRPSSQEKALAESSQPAENGCKKKLLQEHPCSSSNEAEECIRWWSNLLDMSTGHDDTGTGHDHDDLPDFTIGVDVWELLCCEEDS